MTAPVRKLKVLFLCTGNSCRSQMAEGWARHLKTDYLEPYSAGTVPQRLDPRAAKVMAEAGVDLSGHFAKTVAEVLDIDFDWVITVCADADRHCPTFPGDVRRLHHGFDDPPSLARNARDEEEALHHYRRVRDLIRDFVMTLPASLESA